MGRNIEWLKTPSRALLLVGSLLAAVRPALDFYQGSWGLAVRRIVGVFKREGLGGVVRRAHILLGRPMGWSGGQFPHALVYGEQEHRAVARAVLVHEAVQASFLAGWQV